METVSESRAFGGVQGVYVHGSGACDCDMTFGLFLPPQAADGPVPLLWVLAGLTCSHENAMVKAGAQRHAAQAGLALVFPDTSPRGPGVADDPAFDLGQGAGFYVDATERPWSHHYRMWSYVGEELPRAIDRTFPVDPFRQAITGHSMGGHGALTLAFRHPSRYASVSAFAPIGHPSQSDWGRKQFTAYLGPDPRDWAGHDATLLLGETDYRGPVLVDQGAEDQFLDLLCPADLAGALARRRQPGAFRMQAGYDHSYFFVASFIADHIAFHARALGL